MNGRRTLIPGAGLPAAMLLAAVALLAGCQLRPPSGRQPVDPGRYCLQLWPSDREAYLMCQQLQNKNRLSFRQFLARHHLSEKHIDRPAEAGDPIARAARHCLDHGIPNYQRVWFCTRQRTGTSH